MTYKYIKEEWKKGQEVYYFEVADEGTTFRQIIESKDALIVSNSPFDEVQFCLSDQEIPFFFVRCHSLKALRLVNTNTLCEITVLKKT